MVALESKLETTQLHERSTLLKEDSNNVLQGLFGIKCHFGKDFHNHLTQSFYPLHFSPD